MTGLKCWRLTSIETTVAYTYCPPNFMFFIQTVKTYGITDPVTRLGSPDNFSYVKSSLLVVKPGLLIRSVI
jgi:hypothetical protein